MSDIEIIEYKESDNDDVAIAIVVSRFNSFVVDRLYDGAIKTLKENGVKEENITVVRVPGAFEIPVAVDALLDDDDREYDAVITLGAIIRGETPHFEYIANECARGISQSALDYGVPVIFGVLTVDNAEQAMDRAARAALEMIDVLDQI